MKKRKLIIPIILIGFFLYLFVRGGVSNELISPKFQRIPTDLRDVVDQSLSGAKGTYGIVIKNLKSNESFSQNEHRVFEPGSLYKIWILASVFNQLEKGNLKEDEILSEDVTTLNKKFYIDEEVAELKDGTITLSVKDALNQMITISHNYAALLLTEKIRLSAVAAFLKEKGFIESTVGTNGGSPTSTPADIALFFEKLYKGELGSKENTDKMLNLLKNQQLNNKLPKYLPEGASLAHKTGEIGWFTHDAGIVFSGAGDYIIVVMSESDLPAGAEDRIANLSKAVYEYFNR